MIEVCRLSLTDHAIARARERFGLPPIAARDVMRSGRLLPDELVRLWSAKESRQQGVAGLIASRVAGGWALWVVRPLGHRFGVVTVLRAEPGWCRLLDRTAL